MCLSLFFLFLCVQATRGEEVRVPEGKEMIQEEQEKAAPEEKAEEAVPAAETEEAVPEESPQKEEGKTHTVKPGDTLWTISSEYMKDPFLWPRVWVVNPAIENPDLIYPGETVNLPGHEEAKVGEEVEKIPEKIKEVGKIEQEIPEKKEEVAMKEVPQTPSLPPPTVDMLLASSGYILLQEEELGIVLGSREGKTLLASQDTILLRPKKGVALTQGTKYALYRKGKKVYHPKTKKYLGNLILILADAEVRETGGPRTTAEIVRSYDYVTIGDRLTPPPPALPEGGTTAEANSLTGYVVETRETKIANALFDVIYIDKGDKDGVRPGDRFRIKRDQPVGELKVLAVRDTTATALVTYSSDVILRGDMVEGPLPAQPAPSVPQKPDGQK